MNIQPVIEKRMFLSQHCILEAPTWEPASISCDDEQVWPIPFTRPTWKTAIATPDTRKKLKEDLEKMHLNG